MSQIKLRTSDDTCFTIDVEIAKCSKTIKTMLDHLGMDELEDIITLPNITADVFKKIIEWANHHKNDPPFSEEDDDSVITHPVHISEWDKEFLEECIFTQFQLNLKICMPLVSLILFCTNI